jgi:hypothetical protein
MSKVLKSLIVAVLFIFVLCGVSFGEWNGEDTSSPIVHDGSEMGYLPSSNGIYPANYYMDLFNLDSAIMNGLNTYSCPPLGYLSYKHYNYGGEEVLANDNTYLSYEDDTLEKLLPYLSSYFNSNSLHVTNWRDMYDYSYQWGSWSDQNYMYHYYVDGVQVETNNPIEAYELGISGKYCTTYYNKYYTIIRAYSWIDNPSILTNKFGYVKASVETYFGIQADPDQPNKFYDSIRDNPNRIWTMFAHINLKDTIDQINAASEANGEGRRILVMFYVSSEPVWTFLD